MIHSITFDQDTIWTNNSPKTILVFGVGGGGGGSGSEDSAASCFKTHTSPPGSNAPITMFKLNVTQNDYNIVIGKGGINGFGGVKGTNGSDGKDTLFDQLTFPGGKGGVFVHNVNDTTPIKNTPGAGGKGGYTAANQDGQCGCVGNDGSVTIVEYDQQINEIIFEQTDVWCVPDNVNEVFVESSHYDQDGNRSVMVELVQVTPNTNYIVMPPSDQNEPQFGGLCTWNTINTIVNQSRLDNYQLLCDEFGISSSISGNYIRILY